MKIDAVKSFAFLALASAVACLSVANARTVIESQGLEPSATDLQLAEEHATQITSIEGYLRHLDQQKMLFESGELGRASNMDRRRLESADHQIRKLLEGQRRATDLSPPKQVALFNAQEEFDAVILNISDPLVCTREQRTGSRLYTSTCQRQSEIDRQHARGQTELGRLRPPESEREVR